jgi:arylsulfatase A-like enzyme
LLTGLYPSEAGIYEERFDRLDDEIETLPEILAKKGYDTFAINSNPNIDPYFGFDQGFAHFGTAGARYTWMGGDKEEKEQIGRSFLPADQLTDSALAYMKGLSKPWFGMLVYIDPHKPYHPPQSDIDAVLGIPPTYHPEYAAEVHHADREIGRLRVLLTEQGVLDNTLVIITSDHGEGLWSHPTVPDSFEHGTYLYDSTNHVPLIFWHPQLSAKKIEDVTSSISIFPTILDWVLPSFSSTSDERPSLRMLIESGTQNGIPSFAFSETHWQKMNKRSVRTAEGRYIFSEDAEDFQVRYRFEEQLPLRERKTLEGPIEEFYVEPSCWSSLVCLGDYREDWSSNSMGEDQESPLKEALSNWHQKLLFRPPLHRDPEDGYSTFTLRDGEMEDVIFLKRAEQDSFPPISEGMKNQLQELGYLE